MLMTNLFLWICDNARIGKRKTCEAWAKVG